MTKKNLNLVLKVLEKIINKDSYALEAIHTVKRDLMIYERRKGNLKNMNDYEIPSW